LLEQDHILLMMIPEFFFFLKKSDYIKKLIYMIEKNYF